ncbi:RNA polymerase sigma-70 factor (ECF subfamily) [Lysobacter niabensis]|uniref:RNA polymerase sigma-70 factor (ECF subfamily) n=1 Tax=Agrilutibacter niabensis TaxID=380628 RepID=A0ABU1VKK1_9GAMM|nr:sigma factor-like helix-turn-helix DNA-binding protein [Lysobacter niabensis]MDR7097865.1 RNA polymerase sigma-70 factor (ECF subfamily) [Lysobacter niabensis]
MRNPLSQTRSLERPWCVTTDNDNPRTGAMPSSVERVWSEFMSALDALAPDVRAAFLLHEVFEAGYDDIASLIGQPADTCRTHVEYAREHALSRMRPPGRQAKAQTQ